MIFIGFRGWTSLISVGCRILCSSIVSLLFSTATCCPAWHKSQDEIVFWCQLEHFLPSCEGTCTNVIRRYHAPVDVGSEARIPSKRNRLRCVRCVRCVWMETGQPIGCSVEAVATMTGCLPTQALAFSTVSIQTQRTQRKRLRLDGNRAWV